MPSTDNIYLKKCINNQVRIRYSTSSREYQIHNLFVVRQAKININILNEKINKQLLIR